MFRKILVPLDRSDLSEQALGRAAEIARAAQGELDLVLVHQPFPFGGFDEPPWNSPAWNADHQYLEMIAAEFASGADVVATHTILKGDAADMISSRADEIGADLIVMTSHGRTGLSRAWLGSVADRVLRRSGVPVLLLRPDEGRSRVDARREPFKHLLLAIDGSPESVTIIPPAVQLAQLTGARVTLLRVVRPIPLIVPEYGIPVTAPPIVPDEAVMQQVVEEARAHLVALAARSSENGVSVDAQIVVNDHVARAILDFAAAQGVDAIAMTTRGRGASRVLVGSTADKVLRATNVPLLVARPK
jgi:nucleotide-binding universal stress UspA family protein